MQQKKNKKSTTKKELTNNNLTTRNISFFVVILVILVVAIYIAFGNGTTDQAVVKRLAFLERKRVMADKDPIIRERSFSLLNNPNKALNRERQKHWQSCQGSV